MTRVLFYSGGMDTGGQSIGLARAFNAHAEGWSARSIRRKNNSIGYPVDVEWPNGDLRLRRVVAQMVLQADMIHVAQVPQSIRHLPRLRRKPIVVHHHGTYFRSNPKAVSAACRAIGATEAVVDYGLLAFAPHAHFLPVVVDIEALAAIREQYYEPSDEVRIFHSPTDRKIKATDALIAAVDRLKRSYPVRLEIVEGVRWSECLRRKATADIVFDQVEFGYGINAVEAWAMRIPVVAGITDPDARNRMIADWGALPFVEATESTIADALESLVADESMRSLMGRIGRTHAERIHSQPAVVERAMAIYQPLLSAVAA